MVDKHEEKPSNGGGGGSDGFMDTVFWIVFVLAVISVIAFFFDKLGIQFSPFEIISSFLKHIFGAVQILSVFLSLAFFAGIIYCNTLIGELLHGHAHHSSHVHEPHNSHSGSSHGPEFVVSHAPNKRWTTILERMSSPDESNWRLAIIEADIILGEMLGKMGYQGEGVAEKLKQVEPSDFKTLQNAWDAHKVRNNIAHQGSSFHLSKRDAEYAIENFKKVFEEFYFI